MDAGKSTLMGHLLYLLGNVNKRTMHKYEQESKKAGKASFAYAWVLDETGEERDRYARKPRWRGSTWLLAVRDAPSDRSLLCRVTLRMENVSSVSLPVAQSGGTDKLHITWSQTDWNMRFVGKTDLPCVS